MDLEGAAEPGAGAAACGDDGNFVARGEWAGEKTDGVRRSLSRSPAGSDSPASVPDDAYSFHADPAR